MARYSSHFLACAISLYLLLCGSYCVFYFVLLLYVAFSLLTVCNYRVFSHFQFPLPFYYVMLYSCAIISYCVLLVALEPRVIVYRQCVIDPVLLRYFVFPFLTTVYQCSGNS